MTTSTPPQPSRRTFTSGLLAAGTGLLSAGLFGADLLAAPQAEAAEGAAPMADLLPLTAAPSEAAQSFAVAAAAYLKTRPGNAAAMGFNLSTGAAVGYRETVRYPTASIVKADILATLLLQAQAKGRALTASEKSLAKAMITRSDNASASTLWTRIGRGAGLAAANRKFHFTDTVPGSGSTWGLTRTSCRDQIRLLWALSDSGSALSAARRDYEIDLMESVVAGQRWGVGAAGSGGTTAVKNGWLPYSGDGRRWVVNSIGRVRLSDGTTGAIAVLSRLSPTFTTGVTTVQRLARMVAAALV